MIDSSQVGSRIAWREPALVIASMVAAIAAGGLVSQGNLIPLGLALTFLLVLASTRLVARQWLLIWLAVGGLFTWAPGVPLSRGLPEMSLERGGILLILPWRL